MNIVSMSEIKEHAYWYAVHTNPRQEYRAENNLLAWNVETYLPKIKGRRKDPMSQKWLSKPLFLRYIFAKFDYYLLGHKIRYTRGVQDVVTFGDSPVPVDNEIIELFKSRQDEFGFVKLEEHIIPGDEVIINDGIFRGIQGVFERKMSNSDRVQILLNTIQYQARIIVEKDVLKKMQAATSAKR